MICGGSATARIYSTAISYRRPGTTNLRDLRYHSVSGPSRSIRRPPMVGESELKADALVASFVWDPDVRVRMNGQHMPSNSIFLFARNTAYRAWLETPMRHATYVLREPGFDRGWPEPEKFLKPLAESRPEASVLMSSIINRNHRACSSQSRVTGSARRA